MRGTCMMLLFALPPVAWSQDAGIDNWQPGPEARPPGAEQDAPNAGPTTDFDPVRVTAPRPQDPFALRNPIDLDGSLFDKYYRAPPTPEDISLNGGYLLYGINQALMKAARQVTRLPGWKHQVRPATARPPPLQDAHMQRALQFRQDDGADDPDQATPNPDAGTSSDDTP